MEDAKITPDMDSKDISEKLKASMLKIKVDGLTGNQMTWTEDGEPNKEPKLVTIKDGQYTVMNN